MISVLLLFQKTCFHMVYTKQSEKVNCLPIALVDNHLFTRMLSTNLERAKKKFESYHGCSNGHVCWWLASVHPVSIQCNPGLHWLLFNAKFLEHIIVFHVYTCLENGFLMIVWIRYVEHAVKRRGQQTRWIDASISHLCGKRPVYCCVVCCMQDSIGLKCLHSNNSVVIGT